MADLSLNLRPSEIDTSEYNDLLVIDGDLVLTSDVDPRGANPVLQDILQNLRFFLGEWFLNNTEGLPWFQEILVKNPDLSKIQAIIINSILSVPGVQNLNEISLTPNFRLRTLNISFRCTTTKGVVVWSGVLNPSTVTGGQG